MDKGRINEWLNERHIVLEENFTSALCRYAVSYQKKQAGQLGKCFSFNRNKSQNNELLE